MAASRRAVTKKDWISRKETDDKIMDPGRSLENIGKNMFHSEWKKENDVVGFFFSTIYVFNLRDVCKCTDS